MGNRRDKDVLEHWLRPYNLLTGSSFRVEAWQDTDSSKKNVDAMCRDDAGRTLAVVHTLIEPFEGEKADAIRFLRTLATLENHPDLLQPGYMITVSQPVNSIPTGARWNDIRNEMLKRLREILPTLPQGCSPAAVGGEGWTLELQIEKLRMDPEYPGKFFTARAYPGDPGPALVSRALKNKVGKLSASGGGTKILLLEKDAAAGTIERQFEQLVDETQIELLLPGIDQIWSVNTAAFESEGYIAASQLLPLVEEDINRGWLNLRTGTFRRVCR